jgi:hypothetical protein
MTQAQLYDHVQSFQKFAAVNSQASTKTTSTTSNSVSTPSESVSTNNVVASPSYEFLNSSSDSTPGFASSKIVASGGLSSSTANPGGDETLQIVGVVFGASGASHAAGIVPDPGATAGTTRYLREDGSWNTPPGGAAGTVTSVSVTAPASTFAETGDPVTTSGTIALTFNPQVANTFLRGPASGSPTAPFWAALVYADLPPGLTSNKRILTVVSSATPTYNIAASDQLNITSLATAITSMSSSMTGAPTDGQEYTFRIHDNGTAQAIAWGANFINGPVTLPVTTVATKTHMVRVIYDAVKSLWVAMAADLTGY